MRPMVARVRPPVGRGVVIISRRSGYFDWTRSPQRSQRWKRSVRKNQRAFGTLCPKTRQRQLIAAAYASSGPTRTSILPMFSPVSRPMKALGAFSIPSTTVSR